MLSAECSMAAYLSLLLLSQSEPSRWKWVSSSFSVCFSTDDSDALSLLYLVAAHCPLVALLRAARRRRNCIQMRRLAGWLAGWLARWRVTWAGVWPAAHRRPPVASYWPVASRWQMPPPPPSLSSLGDVHTMIMFYDRWYHAG